LQLKNIEIKGFKSFADKTILNFDNRITGIVGPNGCGKSNVVDAVRWVLGEQRTSALRSDKMDNLIFNGTSKRRSAGVAQVSLVFENTKNLLPTEFSTVKVTRMLHRSGESEYRLNDVNCRLKDITNLFTDTGVSSDSYAIIELKMIDDILHDQENSRKRLFDNAAGISKYKKRKREALLKLNATGGDLDRVEDLLHEIEANMKVYESQARKAERFKKLKEKYRVASLQLGRIKLINFNEEFKSLEENKTNHKDVIVELSAGIQQIEASIEQQKKVTLDKEKILADKQKQLNEHLDLLRAKENEKNLINENLKFLRQQQGEYENSKHKSAAHIDQLVEEIKTLEQNLIEANSRLKTSESNLAAKENELAEKQEKHATVTQNFNTLKQKQAEFDRKVFELEKKIAVNQSQKVNLEKEISEKTEQLSDREKEILALKDEFSKSKQALEVAEQELQTLLKKEQQELAELTEIESKISAIQTQLQKENRILDKRTNEQNLLKDLINKLEGFPDSIRFLSQNKQWSKSAPLLSDIINCKEDFKIPIENYLAPYLNYYVVDNIEEGINAINLLSDAAKGRANFFILNQIEAPDLETIIPTNGGIMATEIIEYDAKYRNLVAHLLGNVYLVDNHEMDKIKSLAKNKDKIYILKSGKLYATNHSISGGSIGLFEGKKLGRAQELQKLTKDIKNLEQNCQQLQAKLNEQEQLRIAIKRSDIRHQIDLKNKEVNTLNNSLVSAKTRYENLEQYISENQTRHTDITDRFQFIDKQIEEVNFELSHLTDQSSSIRSEVQKAESNFNQSSEEVNRIKTELNEVNIKCLQDQNEADNIKQKIDFKHQQIEKDKTQLETSIKAIENTKVEIVDLERKLNTDDEDLSKLYDDKDAFAQHVVSAETDYFTSKEEIDGLDKKLRKEQKQKQEKELLMSNVHTKINDLKLKLVSLKDRISIEFNIEVDSLMSEEHQTNIERTELEMQLEKYKRRLDNYGEVNTLAIDAYNEIKERYEFINGQKTDLLDAKDNSVNCFLKEIHVI